MMAQAVNIQEAKKDSINSPESSLVQSQNLITSGLTSNQTTKSPVDIIMDDTLS
jgi:hypothetical protein